MKIKLFAVALAMLVGNLGRISYAQQPVLQRGYDSGLSGANLTETSLTTSNVNSSTFGLKFTLPVDADVYAQPLYVPHVTLAGKGTHNVLYVATMNDTLYAFDADTGGAPLWSVNFASSVGAMPVPIAQFTFNGNQNIVGNLGILSTPVIDPSTNILYLVACTLENSTLVYRLHAVNITNGTEPLPNTVISGSYKGATFDARYQTQRVSLALAGNQIVFAFGAVELESNGTGYSGWVMAYNKQTLAQSGAFAAVTPGTTNSSAGGIWQSGRAPAVDSAGYIYLFTGNGYNTAYNGATAFSESVLKLDPANGLALVDWFTPDNWSSMDANDADLSSSGPMIIPNTSPSLLAGGGKTGILYVLNTTNMGKETATDSGVVQEQNIAKSQIKGGPVYWQRSTANGGPLLYDWGTNDSVKAYAFSGTKISAGPTSQGSSTLVYPGGILALSANGGQAGSGVLWATAAVKGNLFNDPTDPGVLYALDANDVSIVLWSSLMNSGRDNFGNFAKFVPPVIVNGKVYVATFSNQIAVYGLLALSPAATPTFSPASGTYSSAQQISLSDATPGAVIHYTTDGSAPTASSPTYASGSTLTINATETIQAIAIASGYVNSAVATGQYVISTPTSAGVSVNLSTVANVTGIGISGTTTKNGGLDTHGYAYATNLLGASLSWSGASFSFGPPNVADAVSSATVPLPAGNYSAIKLLGTAANGDHATQTFVITYTDGTMSSFTQSLSDWGRPAAYPGESTALNMPYRIGPSGTQSAGSWNLYGYSFPLNSAKTVKSITLPSNRNVVMLAIDLVPPSNAVSVNLMPVFNVLGIGSPGTDPRAGGLDTNGYVYAANLLDISLSWSGATFTFGSPNAGSAASGGTILAPEGNYSSIKLLGTGVNGNQGNQTFVITYTDGTTTSFTQSLSDWGNPAGYAGESTALNMPYRVGPTGAQEPGSWNLYGYSFPLNSAKTVKSITLPNNRNVVVLAIDLGAS